MLHFLQFITIIYGVVCVLLPAYYGAWFWAHGKGLIGRRLAYMLYGEAISMAIAVYFAINSFVGVYNDMSPELAMSLRWLIFSTALFSTIKLVSYLRKVQDETRFDRRQTDKG